MDGFLNWFFSFITSMFGSLWSGILGFFKFTSAFNSGAFALISGAFALNP